MTGDKDLLVLDGNPALGKLKIVTVKELLGYILKFDNPPPHLPQ